MVLVVNEHLADGWFGFLTGVRLTRDRKFDETRTRAAAKTDAGSTDREVAAAAAQRQEEAAKLKTLEKLAASILDRHQGRQNHETMVSGVFDFHGLTMVLLLT